MVPGSAGAALFLLALVPGLIYLRRTASVRPPAESTALQEALEVVAIGVATTGVAVGAPLLIWGSTFVDAMQLDHADSADLRRATLAGSAVFALSCIVALIASWARCKISKETKYSRNVWESVFGEKRGGTLRHITVELADGRTFDGPLHSYTVVPAADGARQIAMKRPIRVTRVGEVNPIHLNYEYVVLDADQVRFVSVTHVANEH